MVHEDWRHEENPLDVMAVYVLNSWLLVAHVHITPESKKSGESPDNTPQYHAATGTVTSHPVLKPLRGMGKGVAQGTSPARLGWDTFRLIYQHRSACNVWGQCSGIVL